MPSTVNTKKKNQPDYVRPEVLAAQDDLHLIHDLLAGTRRMHEMADERDYIRQWADEENKVYRIRSRCEQLYNGIGRTLSAAIGMLFQKPPVLTFKVQETVFREDFASIDGAGTGHDVAAKRFAEWALRDGYAIILVDHPSPPTNELVTAAKERDLGLRPTWAFYERQSAINWRVETIGNEQVLTLLVLCELDEAADGTFGVASTTQYRVLRLVNGVATWQVWREPAKGAEEFELVSEGQFLDRHGKAFTRLPVAVAYAGRTDAPFTAVPPLRDVAEANLGHWQQATNLRFYREVASFPQPTVIGELASDSRTGTPIKLKIGPMVVVRLKGADAKFGYTELEGKSLDQVEKGVTKKEHEIAALGMSFLARDKRTQETAEAKRLDATAENSTLATSAQGIEDAWNLALEFHARFRGIPKAEAPTVAINRQYDLVTLGAAEMSAVANLVKAGMPVRQAVQMLHAGGVIVVNEPKDLDLIAFEWEAGAAAAAAEKELREERENKQKDGTGDDE
jgi:hypothetical protein